MSVTPNTPFPTTLKSTSDTFSFFKGSTEPELWLKSLGAFTDEQAERYGDKPALIVPWQSATLSYRQLADRSWEVAERLHGLGLRHGDRVGIMAGNRFEYLVVLIGAARLGCPVVVLNNTYTPDELHNALQVTGTRILFIAPHIGPRDMTQHIAGVSNRMTMPNLIRIVLFDEADHIGGTVASQSYPDFLRLSPHSSGARVAAALVSGDDTINLQFTSGTTGAPKAAMLTSINVINNGRFIGDNLELNDTDIICCPPPLFHCFGLVLGFMATFTHGSAIMFPSDTFNAAKVLECVVEHKATVLYGVPTMFVAELELLRKSKYKPTTLRSGLAAGSAVPAALAAKLREEMGLPTVLIAYGMTETSPVTAMTAMTDSLDMQLNSIGRIIPHTMAKVIDKEGNILPRGHRGEICTTGFGLQKGYWQNQAKTDEVMKRDADGVVWMHTGDEGVIDHAGYAYITGRIKDMIIRGGENIFPREIEERLLRHRHITEASIVGVPDEKYGEVVVAFLRLAEDAHAAPSDDEVRHWTGQKLGRHKAPKHVFWVGPEAHAHVEDYPKTGSGKHQKHILRDIGDQLVKKHSRPAKL